MRLSSIQLQAFVEVARTGGISRAAEALHVTQSALSQRIQNLEEELGVTLFLRNRAGTRLTPAGETLLRHCRTQEAMETELLHALRGGDTVVGEIRIGAFSTVLRSVVLPALAGVVAAHRSLRVEAVSRELRDLPELLRSGEIDYALLDHAMKRPGICAALLGYEENVLVADEGGKSPTDVYLDHDGEDTMTERYLRRQGERAVTSSRLFLDEIYAILDGVALGWGRAVVPRHLLRGRSDIVVIPGGKPLVTPVVLHYAEQPCYPKVHALVVETLMKNAPELLTS
jgi:DNA-binding transcriptional LysR family regulator